MWPAGSAFRRIARTQRNLAAPISIDPCFRDVPEARPDKAVCWPTLPFGVGAEPGPADWHPALDPFSRLIIGGFAEKHEVMRFIRRLIRQNLARVYRDHSS